MNATTAYCSACGKKLHVKAEICPKCGVRIKRYSPKSRAIAAALALFLGGIGAHKFYLGRIGMGFLYLFFCWTFIPAFIALIEFLVYLFMDSEKFAEKYAN